MERENFTPPELTGQGQNTYPKDRGNIMPDGGSGLPESNTSQGSQQPSERHINQARQVANSENTPEPLRRAAQDWLSSLNLAAGRGSNIPEGFTEGPPNIPADENIDMSQARPANGPRDPRTSDNVDMGAVNFADLLAQAVKAGNISAQDEINKQRRSKEQAENVVERIEQNISRYGNPNERDLDEALLASTRKEREQFFDRLFLALDSRPEEFSDQIMGPLTAPGSAYEGFITALNRLASSEKHTERREEFAEDLRRFQKEFQARKVIHDVTAILYIPGIKAESLFGYVEKFESSLVDMVFTTPGIRQMVDLYEYSIRESMATHKHQGYLDPEKIRSKVLSSVDDEGIERRTVTEAEIDIRTKDLFRSLMQNGMIKSRTKDGREFTVQGLQEWEIDRLFNFARGELIASGRLISLAAESKLPPAPTRFASAFLQDLVQEYSALKHLNAKWGITAEALAAYLYEGSTGNVEADRLLKRWNPKELDEMWKRYNDNPDKLLNSLEHTFYLGRMNPNRAGDVWTWMSWRADNRSDVPTMVQNFIIEGQKKQANRWNVMHPPSSTQPSAEEYIRFLEDPAFEVKDLDEEEFFGMTKEARDKLKHEREHHLKKREDAWREAYPNAIGIDEFEKFYKEYEKWTGTGYRFEKMRGSLDKAVDYTAHYHGDKAHEEKERAETIEKGMKLLKRISEIQGHRFYGISEHIRKRVESAIAQNPQMKDNLAIVLGDVQLAEAAMLNAREDLLEAGIGFDQVQLAMPGFDFFEKAITGEAKGKDGIAISREDRIKLAKEFVEIMKRDFEANETKYKREFISHREYTHGFVLWTGDVPIDEYNAASVGPTGAFVRRARDNKNQALATGAETKMLDNLKNVHSIEQLIEHFEEIFGHIDHYDRGKAQQAIAEKAYGILKFYKSDSITKIPAFGLAWKTFVGVEKESFARMVYGPHALAMESSDIAKVIDHLAHTKKISHEWEKWLKDKLGASDKHLYYELGLDAGELGFLALLYQLVDVIGDEIGAGIQDAA
jgi:hypothetical protein